MILTQASTQDLLRVPAHLHSMEEGTIEEARGLLQCNNNIALRDPSREVVRGVVADME